MLFFCEYGRSVFTAMLTADVQILSHIWVGLAVPNLAELEVAKQPGQQGEAAMTLGKHLCKSPDGFSMVLIYGL